MIDRRLSPRVEWNGPMKYRLAENQAYRNGILADVSMTGAMIWIPDDSLKVGDKIEVVMQSEFDPKPVHMHMYVVRIVKNPREKYTGYGCQLEMHEAWEDL